MALIDNILAYWNLNNDGSGAVSLVDSTGNGNAINAGGSPIPTLGTGIIEGGAVGNGAGYFSSTNSFNLSGDFTINYWTKGNFTTNTQQFAGNLFGGLNLNVASGSIYIGITNVALVASHNFSPNPNTWYMATAVRSGANVVVYLDGSSVASAPFSNSFNERYGILAINDGSFVSDSNGVIVDEVGIWNRALSPTEVTSLYNGGAGLSYPFEALYFNAAVDGSFGTLGNYWEDSSFTIPATALPTASDFVFILANATSGTLTGDSIRIVDSSVGASASIVGNVTLTGNSTNAGTITGNVVVEYPAQNPIGGTISGTITYSYPNGNGPWGSIYYINGEATTLDLDGNGVWEGVTYVNGVPQYDGLFFTNSTLNGDFFTLSNWNFTPDGTGATPEGIPWTPDGNGGFWYSDLNLFSGDGANNISAFGSSIGGSGITGTCSINNFYSYSSIYGGTFSGDNFYSYGTIYGGTFSGNNFVNFGSTLLGGTFISPAVTISTSGNMTTLSMNGGPTFSYPTPTPSGGGGGIDIARLIGLPPFINL